MVYRRAGHGEAALAGQDWPQCQDEAIACSGWLQLERRRGRKRRFCRQRGGTASEAQLAAAVSSGQPALASAVVLDVVIVDAFAAAEIELLDIRIFLQRRRVAAHDDAAVFDQIGMVGYVQRRGG